MRSTILFLLVVFIHTVGYPQQPDAMNALVSLYPKTIKSPEELALFIARDFDTPLAQLKAAYTWLVNNVAYDPEEYYAFKFQYRILEERNQKAAQSREEIIERTLQNGKAVCEGYALTLERLCELLHINAYVVRGDTKTRVSDIGRPFDKNHMWMVALIDKKAVLADPTWGAGRYDGQRFVKDPTYYYFNTPHAQFLQTHMPEVFSDAYVGQRLSRTQFSNRPLLIQKGLKVEAIMPTTGILSSKELKDGISFSIAAKAPASLTYSINGQSPQEIAFEHKDGKLIFTISAKTKAGDLIIYTDKQPLIGYKIKK
jgi:hypothetical protein